MHKFKLSLLLISILTLQACGFWTYKSDFDCPIPKGVQCKSLYEVNKMADTGKFSPGNEKSFVCREK